MFDRTNKTQKCVGPGTFLVSGYLMLLVVLLSALAIGGQPRSRLVGSAFDPTAISVAVSPKKPKLGDAIEKATSTNPDDLNGGKEPLVALGPWHFAAPSQPALATHALFARHDNHRGLAPPPTGWKEARAPPLI